MNRALAALGVLSVLGLGVYAVSRVQGKPAAEAAARKAQSDAIAASKGIVTITGGNATRKADGTYVVQVRAAAEQSTAPIDPLTGKPSVLNWPRRKGSGWVDCNGTFQNYDPDGGRGKVERCLCRSRDGKTYRALRTITTLLGGRPDVTMPCKGV